MLRYKFKDSLPILSENQDGERPYFAPPSEKGFFLHKGERNCSPSSATFLSSGEKSISQPFTLPHQTTKHSGMVPDHQVTKRSMQHEISSKSFEFMLQSEKVLGASQNCMPGSTFTYACLQKKVYRSPFGPTIHKTTVIPFS